MQENKTARLDLMQKPELARFLVLGFSVPLISLSIFPSYSQAAVEEEGVMLEAIFCTHKHW